MKLTDIFTHTNDGIYEADTKGYHIVAVTTHFGATLLNIAFEYYRIHEDLVGGIRSRDGGYHEIPRRVKTVAKKPTTTVTFTPNDALRTKYFAELRECEWTQTL